MIKTSRRTLLAASSALAGVLSIESAGSHALGTALTPAGSDNQEGRVTARQDENAAGRPITFADIAHWPAPGTNAPSSLQFSPDGSTLTYLYSANNTMVQELWAYDLASGREWILLDAPGLDHPSEADFTRIEEIRRERTRQNTYGVTDYAWGDSGKVLMARRQGEVLVRPGVAGEWRALPGSHVWIDPQLSPDETRIAFAFDGELHVFDLEATTATPRQLTFDASPPDAYGGRAICNGIAEYDAQEELGRMSGFWWSPDGNRLLFQQANNEEVPPYLITHAGTPTVEVESLRYPFAGRPLTRSRLGSVPATGGDVTWLDLGADPDVYLARVDWTPDGYAAVQVLARDQQHLTLLRIDPATGDAETIWVEEVQPWINLSDDLRFIHHADDPPDMYSILWSSERTGWRELYLYDRDGTELRQLTDRGAYIDGVATVDANDGWLAFHGWQGTPLERQLFRVSLDGGAVEQMTQAPGTHRCTFAPDRTAYVDLSNTATSPPAATLRALDGATQGTIQAAAPPDPLLAELQLPAPEFVDIAADDGTILHGAIYRPHGLAAGSKSPVIVSVYGGPTAQRVVNGWVMTSDLRPQALAQQGYLVFVLDNRGTARRGLEFEAAVNRHLGDVEVQDQVAGVRWLAANVPEADTDRVGIYGWSYGGYMSLMCLARAPEVFSAAAAGGPVTLWEEYDSAYTERYMGRPQDNADGYRESAVLTHAGGIQGALFLSHGLIDENVHFRHTGRLIQEALITTGVPFALQVFPEARHHLRREADRIALEEAVFAFFAEQH